MSRSGTNTRHARRSRPALEGLERRELLSGTSSDAAGTQVSPSQSSSSGSSSSSSSSSSGTIPTIHDFRYTTPQGTHVLVTLYGDGTLYGTTVGSDGGLNLRFSGTNADTGIVAKVHGGTGYANLDSLEHLFVPANSLSGIGSSLLNVVNLKDFNLVSGGTVNLTGGVHVLFLNSIAADTQVNLRETPPSLLPGGTSSTSATENGVNLAFLTNEAGATTLSGVSGVIVPGVSAFNLLTASNTSLSSSTSTTTTNPPNPAPSGVVISIKYVNGPPRDSLLLGTPQVFGYDPITNSLIRFDTTTGNPTLTIPNALPAATAGAEAGVTLGRDNNQLVVLISDGTTVYAYNPLDGALVGSFSLSSLTAEGVGLNNPTRLATFDSYVAVSDPYGGTGGLGVIQPINVTESLATGMAVALGPAYQSQRAFGLSGGLTGVPGLTNLYAAGGAVFDPYQPLQTELGISSLTPAVPSSSSSQVTLTETARDPVLTQSGATIPTNTHGGQTTSPDNALGSINQELALDTGLTTTSSGQIVNAVSLISPTSFTLQGTITLNDPNLLTDLSGSFRPQLAGAALVDVQGDTQSFRSRSAQGLVFNGEGNVNLVKIEDASDTTIVGFPFAHAQMPHRSDVTILSSTRVVGTRNGVTVLPNIEPTGPLSLP